MTQPFQNAMPPDSAGLTASVQKYFDLMHDCDASRLHEVFYTTSHLHGYRDGQMVAWSYETYRDILAKRESPKSRGEARADETLMIDFAGPEMAFVKVRLRIGAMRFIDYLTWHQIDGRWLITSKGFHLLDDEERPI